MVVAVMTAGVAIVLLVAACLHKRNFKLGASAGGGSVAQGGATPGGAPAAQTQTSFAPSMQECKRGMLEVTVDLHKLCEILMERIISSGKRIIGH